MRSPGALALALLLALGGAGKARASWEFFSDLFRWGRSPAPAREVEPVGNGLLTGFNQGWLRDRYGSQWTSGWDEDEARRMLQATRQHGGSVLRVWLFEGLDLEGVEWDGSPLRSVKGYGGRRTRPTGISTEKLANLERFLELCAEEDVRAYLTLFDANIYRFDSEVKRQRRGEWWNLLNDKWGAGQGFRETVLAPVLEVLDRHRPSLFGIDLINEGNVLVYYRWFEGGWGGARKFVRTWRSFIRERLEVPVTMSFGHPSATGEMLAGMLPRSAVDFYDFHLYRDDGRIPREAAVRKLAERIPIYLGEYGQASKRADDDLQLRVVRGFLESAHRAKLKGAFAWRLSERPFEDADEDRFSFEREGGWRPAAAEHRRMSGSRGTTD